MSISKKTYASLSAVVAVVGFGAAACGTAAHHSATSVPAPTSVATAAPAAQTATQLEAKITAALPGGTWSERGADVTGAYAGEDYLNADNIPPVVVSQYRDAATAEQAVSYYDSLNEYSPVVADGSIVVLVSNTATPAEVAAVEAVLPAGAATG
jgi:hypothetical protein